MKATAIAPANIAFIKYWGKINEKLRLPANSSISMNLSEASSRTFVEFNSSFKKDTVFIGGKKVIGVEEERVIEHLDRVRKMAGMKLFAKVISENNFPKSAGIASSASGFAALSLAASTAAGLNLSEKDLSILARLGSGSACRSIPDGFVEWKFGQKSGDSFASSLYPSDYWDIYDLIVIVGGKSKKISSTEGHTFATSSPFYKTRILGMEKKVAEIKNALKNKDFTKFGTILEAEAINMHTVMMTSSPPLYYLLPESLKIIYSVMEWRETGLEAYFTIDAGPNIHIICRSKDIKALRSKLGKVPGIESTIVNRASRGASLIK